MWHNDYKIPNGVHAYGRRFEPYGPDNYPYEIAKIQEMTAVRDTAICQAAAGIQMAVAAADARTSVLPDVETSFEHDPYADGGCQSLEVEDAVAQLTAPDG